MVRTTNVELRGDKYKAEQLSLAHTKRLLEIFRANTEFQNLRTNKHREDFFDDTGKFIGSIYLQTNYGIENVLVEVASGGKQEKKRKKQELYKDKFVSRIVPCIRSSDNLWWVACLSGTFEGPYYAFPNVDGAITVEQMDDNAEVDLDGMAISVGAAPLGAGGTPPRLVFVAQTGIRPELSDYGLTDDTRYATDNIVHLREAYITTLQTEHVEGCVESCSFVETDFSGSDVFYRVHTIWGSEITALEPRFFGYTEAFSGPGTMGGAVTHSLESFGGHYTHTKGYYVPTVKGARFEEANINNFACCYTKFVIANQFDSFDPYEGGCGDICTRKWKVWAAPETWTKEYWFQVGEDKFLFYAPPAWTDWVIGGYYSAWNDLYPGPQCNSGNTYTEHNNSENNMVKYYGPESAAKITGIMCGRVTDADIDPDTGEVANEKCLEFIYNYVGPNNRRDGEAAVMTTTIFAPANGGGRDADNKFTHEIDNVAGLPSDVFFAGEIFLGQIEYTTKQKVMLSTDEEL